MSVGSGCKVLRATRLARAAARHRLRVLPPDCLGSVGAPAEPIFSEGGPASRKWRWHSRDKADHAAAWAPWCRPAERAMRRRVGRGLERVMQVRVGGFGQHGEADQLAHEVASHVAALRRYALVLVGDGAEADDLVQESLSRVLAQTRSWRPVHDLRAYMFTTLHNVFVDHSRRQRVRRSDVPLEHALATLSLPANQLKRLEFRDLITSLGKLPSQQREVVLLIGLEGMSYMEAARVLGVPIGTVMSRLSRGREALRQLMSQGAIAKLRVVK